MEAHAAHRDHRNRPKGLPGDREAVTFHPTAEAVRDSSIPGPRQPRAPKGTIVCVDNLSADPYCLMPPMEELAVRRLAPRQIPSACRQSRVLAALIPVATTPVVSHVFEPLGEYGIGCRGPVRSVLFVSGRPLEAILRTRAPVHLSQASVTSSRLFLLLCKRTFGVLPALTRDVACAAGRLVIGDEAIALAYDDACRMDFRIDLGEWWRSETGLPFVFARWMVRRDAPARLREDLLEWLADSIRYGTSPEGIGKLAFQAHCRHARGAPDTAFSLAHAAHYYRGLRLELGPEDRRGALAFLRMCRPCHP